MSVGLKITAEENLHYVVSTSADIYQSIRYNLPTLYNMSVGAW